MKKGFITLSTGQQFHYRSVGDGAPLIMLHSSPQNSEALMPAAQVFAQHCHCIALDTPGYGLSDAMDIQTPNITDYAENIIAAIDELGLKNFCLYGAATGSQIAIEIGKRYPQRVKFLMLDSNGHVSDEHCARILKGYFPSVKPLPGGGHLLTYWEICRGSYTAFPWTSGKVADGCAIPLPPAVSIQQAYLRYLDAGETYDLAYKAAFLIEKRDHMNGLNVPTIMTRWTRSVLISIVDELIKLGLPECVTLLHSDGDKMDRMNVQAEALGEALKTLELEELSLTGPAAPISSGFQSIYLGDDEAPLHAKINLGGSGNVLLCLHDSCRSSAQFLKALSPLIGKRPMILLDLPGHGASMQLENSPTVPDLADMIAAALKNFKHEGLDIAGIGLGASIGAALSDRLLVDHLTSIKTPNFSRDECADYLKNGIPDLTPRHDGTHLVRAWYMIRAQALYRLWYRPDGASRAGLDDADLSPDHLHERTLELLRTGRYHGDFMRLKIYSDLDILSQSLNVSSSVVKIEEVASQLA